MVGLDYFLNKNWIKKNKKHWDNDSYAVKVFTADQENMHFNFKERILDERYLFDYAKAFSIPRASLAWKEIQMVELLSLLILDGNLEEKNPKKIRKAIFEISGGRKPKNRDERKVWNLIEALDLIKTEKFEINEDNYELLTHIMFRNLGYNLDIKDEFYRNPKTKSQFKNLLDPLLIDQELKSLISYIHNLKNTDLSGFTQSLIIFLSFLYISPYQQNNLMMGLLLSQWFLFTLENKELEILFPNPVYNLVPEWKNFVDLINQTFSAGAKIDELTQLLMGCAIEGVNMSYRLNALNIWIEENSYLKKHLFVDSVDKVILLSLFKTRVNTWKMNKIMHLFKFQDRFIFSRKEVENFFEKLTDAEIFSLQKKNEIISYQLNNAKLLKIQMLLKN